MDNELFEIHMENARKTARIETLVEDMHERLFDNEAGFVTKTNDRIQSLEHSRSTAKGAFAVVGGILSFVGWPHFRALFK